MTMHIIRLLSVMLIGVSLLSACKAPKKTPNVTHAEALFKEARTAGAAELAPKEFYEAAALHKRMQDHWENSRWGNADYQAALCVYLCEAALARTEAKKMQAAIKEMEYNALKAEKEITVIDNRIKDLVIKNKNMTIEERNQRIANREKTLETLQKKYRELYDEKLKDEENAIKNINDLTTLIDQLKRSLKMSKAQEAKLTEQEKQARKEAEARIAQLNKKLNSERERAANLQGDKEKLALKVNAEKMKARAMDAIGNAKVMKVKAESMGAKKGASRLFGRGDTTLRLALGKLEKNEFLESRIAAINAQNLFNDAINEANKRYLEETERLKQAREEIKKIFEGLEDTEITDEKGKVKIIMRGVLFGYGKAKLNAKFHEKLTKLANILLKYREFPVSVEGHTDDIGKDAYNLSLSSDRAGAVSRFLIEKCGLPSKRIVALGYGKSRPIAPNTSTENRTKNRRVEIILLRNLTTGN